MIFAILPVKSPRRALQRLRKVLSPIERERLARVMFRDVLEKLLAALRFDRVAVASSDRQVLDEARGLGALALEERSQRGHSASADWAAERAMDLGARTILLAPIDVPLVTSEEFDALIATAGELGEPGLVIVPSRDGAGTNALVRSPPDVIRGRFGPGSFGAHARQAREKGVMIRVEHPPGIVFDIDTPEDLVAFGRGASAGAAWEYLVAIDALARAREFVEGRPARNRARLGELGCGAGNAGSGAP